MKESSTDRELELPIEREHLKQELLRGLPEEHPYYSRLESGYGVIYSTYSHLARFSYVVEQGRMLKWFLRYFTDSEKEETRIAGNLGGIWGINTRIFDDLMDGDGCEIPSEPEEFWENYIRSFKGEESSSDREVESLALKSAHLLSENLDGETRQKFLENLQELSNVWRNEDKSKIETYEEYLDAVGELGRMTVLAGCSISGTELEKAPGRIGYEVAISTQVADDIFDGDTGLEKEELAELLREKRRDFKTNTGKFFGLVLSDGYGPFSKLIYIISEADSKQYGLSIHDLVKSKISL